MSEQHPSVRVRPGTVAARIVELHAAGLDNFEIGVDIGRGRKYVATVLSQHGLKANRARTINRGHGGARIGAGRIAGAPSISPDADPIYTTRDPDENYFAIAGHDALLAALRRVHGQPPAAPKPKPKVIRSLGRNDRSLCGSAAALCEAAA